MNFYASFAITWFAKGVKYTKEISISHSIASNRLVNGFLEFQIKQQPFRICLTLNGIASPKTT